MDTTPESAIEGAAANARALTLQLRQLVTALGGRGRVPHALSVAATHAQDALGQILIAQDGGSLGI